MFSAHFYPSAIDYSTTERFIKIPSDILPQNISERKVHRIILAYFMCFNIHFKCPYSVASDVQCSLIGVISASFGQFNTLYTI